MEVGIHKTEGKITPIYTLCQTELIIEMCNKFNLSGNNANTIIEKLIENKLKTKIPPLCFGLIYQHVNELLNQ